jgi:PKD repeat protein
MGSDKYNLEDFFQESFKDFKNIPGEHVLKKIRFKLWLRDFFSFRLNKVNVVYTSVAVSGIILAIAKIPDNAQLNDKQSDLLHTEQVVTTSNTKETAEINETITSENNKINEKKSSETAAVVADFTVSVIKGCAPLLVSFNNESLNATEYNWDFDNGISSSNKNPSQLFSKPGIYKVKLKAGNKKKMDEKVTELHILSSPKAICEINLTKSTNKNKTVHFKNKSKNASSYLWDFGDGNTSEGKNNVSHTYSDYGVYKVTLVAKNETGCSDSTTLINRFIEKNYLLAFPNTFRPDPIKPENNGFYQSSGNERFVFYPKNNGVSEYILEIFAGNGMKVFSTKDIKRGWNGYVKSRIAPPGDYFYKSSGKYPNGEAFDYQGSVRVIVDNYDYY